MPASGVTTLLAQDGARRFLEGLAKKYDVQYYGNLHLLDFRARKDFHHVIAGADPKFFERVLE